MPDSPRGRLLAWLLLLLLAVSAVEVRYLTILSPANLRVAREWFGNSVDQPGYPEFLREVESRTPPGSRIAIVVPRRWSEGYAYAYYRANYLVGDRVILPAIGTDDAPILAVAALIPRLRAPELASPPGPDPGVVAIEK